MELRGPDPAGNPYLVIGLILAAGLDGIQRKLPLPEAVNRNLFHPSAAAGLESLPHTLREAITVAGQSEFISAELPVALQTNTLSTRPSSATTPNLLPTPTAGKERIAS